LILSQKAEEMIRFSVDNIIPATHISSLSLQPFIAKQS
jgi:hypothetical protein